MPTTPRIAVRAIITDDQNRILLLKRAKTRYCNGCWNLPGGKLEYGEAAESAIRAEVLEETSLEVKEIHFLTYLDNLPASPREPHYITLFFHCNTRGSIIINAESSSFRWVSHNELPEFNIAFRNEEVMQRFWAGEAEV